MSFNQSLGADLTKNEKASAASKRKMTAAIIEEQERDNEKEHYEFLESDDDFEEFEVPMPDDCDVEMTGADRHLWVSQQDWDEDESSDADFQTILRQQLAKTATAAKV